MLNTQLLDHISFPALLARHAKRPWKNPQNKIGVGGKNGGMAQRHVQYGPLMWTNFDVHRFVIFSIV